MKRPYKVCVRILWEGCTMTRQWGSNEMIGSGGQITFIIIYLPHTCCQRDASITLTWHPNSWLSDPLEMRWEEQALHESRLYPMIYKWVSYEKISDLVIDNKYKVISGTFQCPGNCSLIITRLQAIFQPRNFEA